MKINVNIECTPEEARTFLGLPDVQPMQRELLDQLRQRMSSAMSASDPEVLLRTWLPLGLQNWDQLQRFFWNQMGAGPRSDSDK